MDSENQPEDEVPIERFGQAENETNDEESIFLLLDILITINDYRKQLIIGITIFFFIGLAYALTAQHQYVASTKVITEATDGESSAAGALSAFTKGLGIQIGGAASGLSVESYPEIIRSREVLLLVINESFNCGFDSTAPAENLLVDCLMENNSETSVSRGSGFTTEREELAIEALRDRVSTKTDPNSGITTISIWMENPILAVEVLNSLIETMRNRIKAIRTIKATEDLAFIKTRFEETQENLRVVENELARYVESHQNVTNAVQQLEESRLKRNLDFNSELYQDLQRQLTQAEIERQRSVPVVTILEKPSPPLKRSSPRRSIIMILAMFAGVFFSLIYIYIAKAIKNKNNDPNWAKRVSLLKK